MKRQDFFCEISPATLALPEAIGGLAAPRLSSAFQVQSLLYDSNRVRTLSKINSNSAVIQIRNPGEAAVLTVPLLACAAALPWFQAELPSTWWVYPVALGGLFLGALAIVRVRKVHVPLETGSILRLEAADSPDDPVYRVVLVGARSRFRLLEHSSVGVLVRDLGRILDATALELDEPSGVGAEYFRSTGNPSLGLLRPEVITSKTTRPQLREIRAAWGAVAFASAVFGWSLLNAQSTPSFMSQALPGITLVLLVLLATGLSRARAQIQLSAAGIRVAKSRLYGRGPVFDVASRELCGAVVFGECRAGAPCHVLLATTRGPRVVTLDAEGALRLVDCIGPVAPLRLAGTHDRPPAAIDPGNDSAASVDSVSVDAGRDRRTPIWTTARARPW